MIRKLGHVVKKYIKKVYKFVGNRIVVWNFKPNINYMEFSTGREDADCTFNFNYFDERDSVVREMFGLQSLAGTVQDKYVLKLDSKEICIDCQQSNGENWLSFIFSNNKDEYIFEFDFVPYGTFCEFQVAFNYESLKNRNRFILMENSEVLFDYIKKGVFFKPIKSEITGEFLKINQKNHITLICKNGYYEFIINGKSAMTISYKRKLNSGRNVAIIFWENGNNRKIQGTISNVQLYELMSN